MLRDYQQPLVAELRQAFKQHRRVIAACPTGFGKTVIGAHVIKGAAERGKVVYAVCHKSFLLQQFSNKLRLAGVRHGIVSPGHYPDPRHNVYVCSLGTLRNRLDNMRAPDWVVLDECHHSSAATWAKMFEMFPQARFLGLTATPERPDGAGLDRYFDTIVKGPSMAEMIAWGKTRPGEGLCDFQIIAKPMGDYSHIGRKDFDLNGVGEAMAERKIIGDVVNEYRQHAAGRGVLIFAPTIAVSERVAAEYQGVGLNVIHLDGDSGHAAIKAGLADFASGRVVGISSVNLFLEGLDVSGVGAIQQLRPTESIVVYLQSLGRGLRSEPGKDHCVILDHVGNLERHGLPDQHREWSLEGRTRRLALEKPIPLWECGVCFTSNRMQYSRCKSCDRPKPVKGRREIEVDASVNLEALDMDLIREQAARGRQEQSAARGVEALVALGKSVGQAQHIEAARREKAYMRAQVREKATAAGDFEILREYMRMKPKALKTYLEGVQ